MSWVNKDQDKHFYCFLLTSTRDIALYKGPAKCECPIVIGLLVCVYVRLSG